MCRTVSMPSIKASVQISGKSGPLASCMGCRCHIGIITLYLRRPLSTKTQWSRSLSTLCTRSAATALSTPPDRAQITWSSGPTCSHVRHCRHHLHDMTFSCTASITWSFSPMQSTTMGTCFSLFISHPDLGFTQSSKLIGPMALHDLG